MVRRLLREGIVVVARAAPLPDDDGIDFADPSCVSPDGERSATADFGTATAT